MALDDDAYSRALMMAGLGMMGQPNVWQALSRGGMFGMQAYDQAIDQKQKRKDQALADQMKDLQIQQLGLNVGQAQDWDAAMKRLAAATGQQGQPQAPQSMPQRAPSIVNAPDWAANPMNARAPNAAPSVRAQATPALGTPGNSMDALLNQLAPRFPDKVKAIFDAQRAGEGKVYGDIQIDAAGKPYVMTERGPKYLDGGIVPREKLVPVDMGNATGFRTDYSPNIVGSVAKSMSPSEAAAAGRDSARLYFETGMGGGGQAGSPRAPVGSQGGQLGSGMFGLAPKTQQDIAKSQKEALNKYGVDYKNNLDQTVGVGNDLMMRVAESQDALKSFAPGMGAEARLNVARAAQALNMPDDLVVRINNGDVSAKQEFMKLSAQQAMESLKQSMGGSGRITQAEFKVFQANNPNIELDPKAIEKIYAFTQRAHTRNLAEQQAMGEHIAKGGDISQWPAIWSKQTAGGIQPQGAPKIGSMQDGFAYIGGDPSKPASWKRLQ